MKKGKKPFMFVIRKIHSAYIVSGNEADVSVEPLNEKCRIAASPVISSTMQMIGFSKMILHHPDDPCQFLKEYYRNLGWGIENA
ncbi:hypothetical protein HRH25_04030 [Flavisolibacter sp. BT320]|nr:hypothetical protein [Flavisolibacter longurius]